MDPKNVITQSMTMVNATLRIYAKLIIVMPQIRYPTDMNALRLPNLSEAAPIRIVVRAAVTALAMTMREISEAEA